MSQADLEITLQRRDAASYSIEMRFSDPGSAVDRRFSSHTPVRFDAGELRQRSLDPTAYGDYLAQQLFREAEVKGFFDQVQTAVQVQDIPLSLRLFVGSSAPELHSIRWETLRIPAQGAPLLMDEHLRFSRYLSSMDWRPVRLRPEGDLRALVVVANPGDLEQYELAKVDIKKELEIAHAGLGDIETTDLTSSDGVIVTLNAISQQLREGYDILYLVTHGMLVDAEPWLFLEKEDGTVDRVPGRDLVTRIRELRDRPRLIVLMSCQSGGTGNEPTTLDDGVLASLGPRLAEAGVPAVLAMQGLITMKTVAAFTPVMFEEIRRDGQIDRAVAVARGQVRERPDWWMPVLFLRLRNGRIWYTPGFADEKHGLKQWPALQRAIERQRCTPILGPGIAEALLGSRRDIATRWAEAYGFPMESHSREDLPQVAQYVLVEQGEFLVKDELEQYLRQEFLKHYGHYIPEAMHDASLDDLITQIGKGLEADELLIPYQVLAQLPLPIFINTDPGNLLAEALKSAGKDPVVEICRWNEDIELLPSLFDDEPDYRPSPERPLVYHLFGRISEQDSLVLTEDDYFDFLMGVTSNNDLIPPVVRRALTDSALLFLGFNISEWDFRVLFRSVMKREGRGRRSRYAHVAAQINPEEGRIMEPEGARHYLESYFGDADINIYWGSVADFAKELRQHL